MATTAASSSNPIDHDHPLFLQSTDTPGISLVSIQLSGSENYALWSRSMRIALLGKSKLGFVNGKHVKENFDESMHQQWEKVNAIVLSWIMNTVSKDLLTSSIVDASNAHKVWTDLKERFEIVDGSSRILDLHKEIVTLTQGTMAVATYFSKLRDFWDEFDALMPVPGCACPESKKYSQHFEYQRLLQFLMGLNESYTQSRSHIMMMSPLPTVNKAYSLIIADESQRNFTQVTEALENTALNSSKGGGGQSRYKGKKGNVVCEHCGCKGHTRDGCYKLIGYPTDYKSKKRGNSSGQSGGTHNYNQQMAKYHSGGGNYDSNSSYSANSGQYYHHDRSENDRTTPIYNLSMLPANRFNCFANLRQYYHHDRSENDRTTPIYNLSMLPANRFNCFANLGKRT